MRDDGADRRRSTGAAPSCELPQYSALKQAAVDRTAAVDLQHGFDPVTVPAAPRKVARLGIARRISDAGRYRPVTFTDIALTP